MKKNAESTMSKEEVVEVDIIVQTAKEVGSLDKETAFQIVPSLIDSVDFSYFKLGGVLSTIQSNGWWESESSTFKAFIKDHIGMHYRKAMYMINIYDGLVEADIPWAKVSGLGWTKLKELAGIINKDNVDEWVEKAKSMNTLSLIAAVKAYKNDEDESTDGVSTITFKVHPDQKESILQAIEQALGEANTEFTGVALEAICLNYLAGGSTKKIVTPSLSSIMEKTSIEQVFEAMEAVFPDINITVEM